MDWVIAQEGEVRLDIFSFYYPPDDYALFSKLSKYISLKNGVNYDLLPNLFASYDVGMILYNGLIPNYIHNAPNKLFEYLACGLDIWFPVIMTGCMPYKNTTSYPKVIAIDFAEISKIDFRELVDRSKLTCKREDYFCELALKDLVDELLDDSKITKIPA